MAPEPSDTPTPVEVEVEGYQDREEIDSGYGDEADSNSSSLRGSIFAWEWKHGRRYHAYKAGSYVYPNDDPEQDRLDILHYAFRLVLNDNLFLAPINPKALKTFDIGTGTGLWAIELADENPGIDIVGIDLSPIQPSWVPLNLRFFVDDIEENWHEPEEYDYIHGRSMAGSIKDWPRLLRHIFKNLKPGGWVEIHETTNTPYSDDGTLDPEDALVRLMDGLREAHEKIGCTIDPAPSLKSWAVDTGLITVTEQRFKFPVGSWPKDTRLKEAGILLRQSLLLGVNAFTNKSFEDYLGLSRPEVEVFNISRRYGKLCDGRMSMPCLT